MEQITCPKCLKVFDSEIEYKLHWSHNHPGVAPTFLIQSEPAGLTAEAAPVIIAEEPNYKDSQKIIGQLYPVLKSKDGQVIDGFHRLAVDPNWKSLVLPEVDTEEKLLVARAVSNWHRRQVPREEKAEWINGLAETYQKQGLETGSSGFSNEIRNKIVEVTGLAPKTVNIYLSEEYKQEPKGGSDKPVITASQRVENELGSEVAERFRKQVLEEEKLSPEERAKHDEQVKLAHAEKERKKAKQKAKKEEQKRKKEEERKQLEEKIRQEVVKRDLAEVKQELLKDPRFQREVLQEVDKAETAVPTQENPEEKGQGLEEFLTNYKEALEKIPEDVPNDENDVKDAIDFFKKLLTKKKVVCPICGEAHLQWRCGHDF